MVFVVGMVCLLLEAFHVVPRGPGGVPWVGWAAVGGLLWFGLAVVFGPRVGRGE